MRPQARPFSVEFKSRNRTRQTALPASRRDDWIDSLPPDDLPERDVREDMLEDSPNGARRVAERLFQRLNGSADHAGEPPSRSLETAPAASIAHPSRVLPDLLAAAREQERQLGQKPERSRRPKSSPAKRSKRSEQQPKAGQPEPAPSEPIQTTTASRSHGEPVIAKVRGTMRQTKKLPRAEKWKERRLPEVCWKRAGKAKRGSG
jgi:hypothetical protein